MEVFVRNFPDQTTEKQINNFFRKVLGKLGISVYHCEKLKGRGCARLTILDLGEAQQFLRTHGLTEPGHRGFVKFQQLVHMGRRINCSLSNNAPDPFLLQSLKKEERDRYAASQSQKPKVVPSNANIPTNAEENRRAFGISQLRCGQWTYVGSGLAFATYYQDVRRGRVLFGTRALLIKLGSLTPDTPSHQIEIPYNSVESFTIGPKSSASMTFSLREAPKFFESLTMKTANVGKSLEDSLQNMGLQPKRQDFKRKRTVALSKSHEIVVSSCLCYRVVLLDSADIARVIALKRFPEIPVSISWNTSDIMITSFAAEMTKLNTALTGAKYGSLPFELKFQMQRLAQNGILGPSKVVELLEVVARHFDTNKDAATVVQSVRNLYHQIPFPGPGTEASDLSLTTLSKLLVQNQESILRGHSYATGLADRYDHITSVHKATVTPAGIYLYGPDDEVKNRVLRKYSAFPNHFLSVAFLDEDGETLRLDRQTSGEDIYWQRYKSLLEGVIIIAGRGYEVR